MADDMSAMSHESTGFCWCGSMHGRIDRWKQTDWDALLEYRQDVSDPCTCGYGGFHEPENPNCERNRRG